MGCPRAAREQLRRIDVNKLKSPLRETVIDTRMSVEAAVARHPGPDPAACESVAIGL
jgi:hypothetical protein